MCSEEVRFSVCFPGGDPLQVSLASSDRVRALREAAEEVHTVPPACLLKLFQAGQLLHDEGLVASLDPALPLFAVVSRESKVEILLQAAWSFSGYRELLASATDSGAKRKRVEEVPTILTVLEEMSGEPKEVERLAAGEAPGTLAFAGGSSGVLLLPSLDAAPLLEAAGAEGFVGVTVSVEINSDAFNRGLGVVVEAPMGMDGAVDEHGLPSYIYNGYGISSDKVQNAVKFHPGMRGGQIRIEGVGGWRNTEMGFTPANWTQSRKNFHTMQITCQADGKNRLTVYGTEDGQEFTKAWQRKLTDGKRLPAIYGWIDVGDSEPLMVGRIGFEVQVG